MEGINGFPVFECIEPNCKGYLRPHRANHVFVCDVCNTVFVRIDNKFKIFENFDKLNFE